jgi:hypothetical protein
LLKGIAGQIVLAVALIIALPMVLDAQESGQVRVSVRVIRSVIPEMQAAKAAWLSQFAEPDVSKKNVAKQSFQTERGYAQITTESLSPAPDTTLRQVDAAAESGVQNDPTRVLMTVAYTAN